jgi:hypothetical protein
MASMVLLALDLIKPKPQQLAECQEEVFNAIVMIWSIPLTTPGPATDKRELREIARALRGAIAALEHPLLCTRSYRISKSRRVGTLTQNRQRTG